MNTDAAHSQIRVLIADDDESILECYRDAFDDTHKDGQAETVAALEAELFETEPDVADDAEFEIVSCTQGDEAIRLAKQAAKNGEPFDVVILDVRMPPGLDGVEAGSQIRKLDPDVEIVFVTGFSDVPLAELQRRVPPPMKLHYFNKPLSFTRLAEDVASMVRTY